MRSGQDVANRCSRLICFASATTRSSPRTWSSSPSATAVWERLCGSIPMMTVIFSSSWWERSPEADKADAGQRAHTPLESRHGRTPASDTSKESQPGSGSRKESQPAGILGRYASKSRATTPHPTISREDRYSVSLAGASGFDPLDSPLMGCHGWFAPPGNRRQELPGVAGWRGGIHGSVGRARSWCVLVSVVRVGRWPVR